MSRDLLVIVGMALGVYVPKVLPLVLLSGRLPPGVRRWLGYVAPAVLAALVAPVVLAPRHQLQLPGWEALGYVAAALVALATRRMFPAIAAGLGVVLIAVLLRT